MGIFFCEMEVDCPKQWEELTPTENPLIRDCADCGKPVHFIDDQTKFDTAALQGHCVAFVSEPDEFNARVRIRVLQIHNQRLKPPQPRRMTLGLPRSPDNSKLRPFIDPMFEPKK